MRLGYWEERRRHNKSSFGEKRKMPRPPGKETDRGHSFPETINATRSLCITKPNARRDLLLRPF